MPQRHQGQEVGSGWVHMSQRQINPIKSSAAVINHSLSFCVVTINKTKLSAGSLSAKVKREQHFLSLTPPTQPLPHLAHFCITTLQRAGGPIRAHPFLPQKPTQRPANLCIIGFLIYELLIPVSLWGCEEQVVTDRPPCLTSPIVLRPHLRTNKASPPFKCSVKGYLRSLVHKPKCFYSLSYRCVLLFISSLFH